MVRRVDKVLGKASILEKIGTAFYRMDHTIVRMFVHPGLERQTLSILLYYKVIPANSNTVNSKTQQIQEFISHQIFLYLSLYFKKQQI